MTKLFGGAIALMLLGIYLHLTRRLRFLVWTAKNY